jgi:hypothetical protein
MRFPAHADDVGRDLLGDLAIHGCPVDPASLVGAHARYGGRDRLPSLVIRGAVACLGAVNATATLAGVRARGLYLLYRRRLRDLALWLAGCGLVSAWWIVPLAVLGTYASPFTDYIESAG